MKIPKQRSWVKGYNHLAVFICLVLIFSCVMERITTHRIKNLKDRLEELEDHSYNDLGMMTLYTDQRLTDHTHTGIYGRINESIQTKR